MDHKLRHYKGFIYIVLFLTLLFVTFFFIDPRDIIATLGVTNSYLVLFFVALIGGASSLTSSSYYATIIAFAASGLNPFLMAIVAGIGLTISDSLFYGIGTWGRNNISGRVRRLVERYSIWLSRRPKRVVQGIVYIYTGFLPLPADILMIILSFTRFPFRHFIIPLLFGNITLVLVIAFGVLWGISLI